MEQPQACRPFRLVITPRDGDPFEILGVYPDSMSALMAGHDICGTADCRVVVVALRPLTFSEGAKLWPSPMPAGAPAEAQSGWNRRQAEEEAAKGARRAHPFDVFLGSMK